MYYYSPRSTKENHFQVNHLIIYKYKYKSYLTPISVFKFLAFLTNLGYLSFCDLAWKLLGIVIDLIVPIPRVFYDKIENEKIAGNPFQF